MGRTDRKSRTIPPGTEHLNKAAIFVAVVRCGSFSGAAEALSMGRSTVSEHVRSLEEHLKVRLIERSTRQLRLTDEGALLFEHMGAVLSSWDEVWAAFDERRDEPTGHLRVTTPSVMASSLITPVLSAFLNRYSEVSAELVVGDTVHDLLSDHIDIAIRMAPLEDSRLVAKKLGRSVTRIVASPDRATDYDGDMGDLHRMPWVGHTVASAPEVLVYRVGDSKPVRVRPQYRALSSSTEGELGLIHGGVGISLMPWLLVEQSIARGELCHVFQAIHGRYLPIYAIYPARQYLPQRTRRFLEMITDAFARRAPDDDGVAAALAGD